MLLYVFVCVVGQTNTMLDVVVCWMLLYVVVCWMLLYVGCCCCGCCMLDVVVVVVVVRTSTKCLIKCLRERPPSV